MPVKGLLRDVASSVLVSFVILYSVQFFGSAWCTVLGCFQLHSVEVTKCSIFVFEEAPLVKLKERVLGRLVGVPADIRLFGGSLGWLVPAAACLIGGV